jgi:hypothetical protein
MNFIKQCIQEIQKIKINDVREPEISIIEN